MNESHKYHNFHKSTVSFTLNVIFFCYSNWLNWWISVYSLVSCKVLVRCRIVFDCWCNARSTPLGCHGASLSARSLRKHGITRRQTKGKGNQTRQYIFTSPTNDDCSTNKYRNSSECIWFRTTNGSRTETASLCFDKQFGLSFFNSTENNLVELNIQQSRRWRNDGQFAVELLLPVQRW